MYGCFWKTSLASTCTSCVSVTCKKIFHLASSSNDFLFFSRVWVQALHSAAQTSRNPWPGRTSPLPRAQDSLHHTGRQCVKIGLLNSSVLPLVGVQKTGFDKKKTQFHRQCALWHALKIYFIRCLPTKMGLNTQWWNIQQRNKKSTQLQANMTKGKQAIICSVKKREGERERERGRKNGT